MSFRFIKKILRPNNLRTRTTMNAKISVLVICIEGIIYLLLYNLTDCTFKDLHKTFWGTTKKCENQFKSIWNTRGGKGYEIHNLNLFSTNVPLLYPLKTSENWRFSGVFKGYWSRILVKNRLINNKLFEHANLIFIEP